MKRSVMQKLKTFDLYGETVKLNFDKGETEFKTYAGGVCSLLGTFILLGYALWQFVILLQHGKYNV